MLKRILIILLSLTLGTLCSCSKKSNVESLPPATKSDMEMLMQVIKGVEDADSFYTVAEGQTTSLGIKQKISARRYVIGNSVFKESISYSSLVKVANQTYVSNGKYLLRTSKKVSSLTCVEWSNNVTDIGKDEYFKRYGAVITGLNNYVLTEQTITGVEVTENECGYVFVLTADVVSSTVNIVKEMKTNAGSKDYPTFSAVKITLTADKNLRVISAHYECAYTVKIAVLGEVDCEEDVTEYFYGFNQTTTFDEKEIFE